MIKRLHITLVAILAFSTLATAQTYPTTSWIDLADISWYNETQDEFTISTAEQFAGVAQLVEAGTTFEDKTLVIDSNIDLDGNLWTPIGKDVDFPFSGSVEGNNYIISNLWIDLPQRDFVGLFGQCTNSSFTDIIIETAHVLAMDTAGTLVGNLSVNSTMDNCHVSNISLTGGAYNCGGLVGSVLTDSSISKSSAKGDVVGVNQIGGLAGTAWNLTSITECYTEGSVSGGYLIGGLIGYCTFAFAPDRNNMIENCYSRAVVTANSGRAGGIYGGSDDDLIISNTYSTGAVTAPEFSGGFIGAFGSGEISITNSYFDMDTSGKEEGVGGFTGPTGTFEIEGRNTADMKTAELVDLLNAGSTVDVWSIDPNVNDGYPVLDNLLSVNPIQAEALSVTVYPTVFETQINVSSDLNLQSYSLYSITGALVSKGSLRNTARIQTAAISSGLYILRINTEKGALTKKVMKK